jgi:hypothetical protein
VNYSYKFTVLSILGIVIAFIPTDFTRLQLVNGQGGAETGQESTLLGPEGSSGSVSTNHISSDRIVDPDFKMIPDHVYPSNMTIRETVSCDPGDSVLGGELSFWNANNNSLFPGPAQMVESLLTPPNSWTISFNLTEKLNEGEQILISATCLDNP